VCILGISPAGDSICVLGDTFLRSAYVVYNLTNNEISLAQINFNAIKLNIMEIKAGAAGVPNALGVANAVSSVSQTISGGARNGGPATLTVTGAAATQTATKASMGGVPGMTAAPWVGAVVGLAGLAAAVL